MNVNNVIVVEGKKDSSIKITYKENTLQVVDAKYISPKHSADLTNADTNKQDRKQFSDMITTALAENKKMAKEDRRSETEVAVLRSAQNQYGLGS